MESTTTPIYRIFLSSTAIDLKEHRQKVKDALLMMGDLPVDMESFGALPNESVEACQAKVRECDVLCVFLAHRYGWVPSPEEGGDGKKSITRIEVETALEAGKSVFVFVVDPNHPWGQPKEQDLLVTAKDEQEELAVIRKVKNLKEFRQFLENRVQGRFTTPNDLATQVVASLSKHVRTETANGAAPQQLRQRRSIFREVHPLQPATHFRGRKELLKDFTYWWNDPLSADRVRSLIAMGGMGKTAFIQYFLANCIDKRNLKGSVLIWSFYENPNTDAFLEEALVVFAGETRSNQGLGGRLPRLQRALTEGERPHLLVLDGLERVQSEGGSGRAWGELENHRIRNLLRSIAGGLGKTRAIITSRFRLTDLAQWEHRGYHGIALDTLDAEGAVHLLQAWGVMGEKAVLKDLAESLGMHALSVSVLGSYLKNYCSGDVAGAAQFELDDAGMDDSQAAKLSRILAGYAQNLSEDERDLLIRLSLFPRGISVEILGYVIAAGGEIAGTLVNFDQVKLLRLARRLQTLGLVYTYQLRNSTTYTAHPFLREYFRQLLGVPTEEIHEAVRGKLAVGLETKPDNKPTDVETLDRYEALIEQTILAGRTEEAYNLYRNAMDGENMEGHLYHQLGDYGRIIRIMLLFTEDGHPETLGVGLSEGDSSYLINDWGLAAMALGDLILAERCFNVANKTYRRIEGWDYLSHGLHNSSWVAMHQGAFPIAKKLVKEALEFTEDEDEFINSSNHAQLAATCHALGEIQIARDNFKKATEIEGKALRSLDGIKEGEYLFRIGQRNHAIEQITDLLSASRRNQWQDEVSICLILLSLFSLPHSMYEARENLDQARQWTDQSGHMECIIRAHILAAEIAICSNDLDTAMTEATTGLNQAETCGYGQFAIDLLIQLARIHLAVPDPGTALTHARRALDWSFREDVRYAWGIADAAELCGKCHEALGEKELAERRFKEAEIAREPLHL